MSLKLKIEYLARVRERYYRSTKKQKTKILDELCAVSGLSRKYAIRILAKKHLERPKKSGRKRVYSKRSIDLLKKLYLLMNQMCSKKMVAALPVWLDFYNDEQFNHEIKEELLSMSAATIDRYLRQYKASIFRRKRTGTKPGKMLKNVIPIKSFDFKAHGPGHVEADTVAHCGTSLSGTFIWTVTFTDVYSGWTENRAIWSKHTDDVLSAIIDFRQKAPFELLSFNTDNVLSLESI